MATIVITLSLTEQLLEIIDRAALEENMKRSEFLRAAALERIKNINMLNAQLAAVAQSADAVTEEDILDMLKLKERQRSVAEWRREHRKYLRERSRQRKAIKAAKEAAKKRGGTVQ